MFELQNLTPETTPPECHRSRRMTSPHSRVKTELMWEMRLGMVKTMSWLLALELILHLRPESRGCSITMILFLQCFEGHRPANAALYS